MSIKGFEVGGVQQRYDYESLDNIPANLVQDANYVHTDNNYTNADKTKLSGIEAQANKTTIDATLTHSGQAADAKATGDAISALNAQVIASMPHDTASGSIASFPDGAAMPVIDCSVAIEPVQSGSGDPSPDNVRPISGWTEAKVTRTGKNLLDLSSLRGGNFETVSVYPSGNVSIDAYIPIKAGQAYTWSQKTYTESGRYIRWYDADKVQIGGNTSIYQASPYTTVAPVNACFARFMWYKATSFSSADEIIAAEPMFELGSTASTYEAYQGQTYTIDLDGTRYGGTLDVTSGKLTVDRAMVDMGTLSWIWYAQYKFYFAPNVSDRKPGPLNVISSAFETKSGSWSGADPTENIIWGNGSNASVYVQTTTSYADAAAFTAAMSGVQLVYELATPIEVDLTPTQITTLLGTNNVWADAGDTTVNYYADTTLFVNKKIAAAVAALS